MTANSPRSTEIARLTIEAASNLLNENPLLHDADRGLRSLAIYRAINRDGTAAAKLKEAFQADASFGDLRSGWIQTLDFGQAMQDQLLPTLAINDCIDGKDVHELLRELREFAQCGISELELYAPIAGATLSATVSLSKDTALIPWADVPESNQKRFYSGQTPDYGILATAGCAVRIHLGRMQVLFSSAAVADPSGDRLSKWSDRHAANAERIKDIAHSMIAIGARPIGVVGQWTHLRNSIARELVGTPYQIGEALHEPGMLRASVSPFAIEANAVAAAFHEVNKLPPSDRAPISIALDRINLASRRRSMVDRAIDLGIALEAILLHEMAGANQGELTYRMAIRGAAFLGRGKPERIKVYKLLRAAYRFRSEAVHRGRIDRKSTLQPEQVLTDAAQVAVDIARHVIRRGSFPDWDHDFVLADEPGAP